MDDNGQDQLDRKKAECGSVKYKHDEPRRERSKWLGKREKLLYFSGQVVRDTFIINIMAGKTSGKNFKKICAQKIFKQETRLP